MKIRYILICLAFLLLGVQTASGWIDHFDADTSGDYTSDLTWEWVTASSWLKNTNAPWMGSTYYTDSTFGSGNYSVQMTRNDANPIISLVYADVDATLGDPQSHGTHYIVAGAPALGTVSFGKTIAGTWTAIDSQALTNADHIYNVTWDKDAHTHKVYVDGVLTIDETDDSITDPGYVGIGSISPNWFHCDWLSVEATAEPTPTPTSSPTPTPFTFPPEPQDGLYIGGEQVQPGIISGIFLVLDQNPFLLLAAVLLVYVLVARK